MKKHFGLIILLAVTILIMIPQLKIPWMLIDDGECLRVATEIDHHFSAGNVEWLFNLEKDSGRFRPLYWGFNYLTYKTLGFNSVAHRLVHLFIYVLIALLIYKIIYEITNKSFPAMLGGLFFLFFDPSRENFYRLGTAEPIFTLLVLSIFYSLMRKNKKTLLIVTTIAYFYKETSVVLMIFSLGLLLLSLVLKQTKKQRKFLFQYLIFNIIILVIQRLIIIKLGIGGWYSQYYVLSISQFFHGSWFYFKTILQQYNLLLLIPALMFVLNIKKQNFWVYGFLMWFILSLSVQVFWVFGMGRYLPPIIIGLLPMMVIGAVKLFKYRKLRIVSALVIIYFIATNSIKFVGMYRQVIPGEISSAIFVEYLAKNTVKNGNVYFNFTDGGVEYLYEIPIHLNLFYHRTDIKIKYFNLEKTKLESGDLVINWRPVLQKYTWNTILTSQPKLKVIQKINPDWQIAIEKN